MNGLREITLNRVAQDLADAIRLAALEHANQVDKQDLPYILHVFRVAASVTTDEERTVAWLHDIVEDTRCTIEDLEITGFRPCILEAVAAITRDKRESYESYIRRVSLNALATAVKIADLRDNLSRIAGLASQDRSRLEPRYHEALHMLGQ